VIKSSSVDAAFFSHQDAHFELNVISTCVGPKTPLLQGTLAVLT
jgi:hypothetical protein